MFRLFTLLSVVFPPFAFAQIHVGQGNSPLRQSSSLLTPSGQIAVSQSEAAKVIDLNDSLNISFSDPNGGLVGKSFGLAIDVRPTRDSRVVQLAGEPNSVLGLSASYEIIVDPFNPTAGTFSQELSFLAPLVSNLPPGTSLRVQGMVADSSYPNNLAFSNSIRFDTVPTLTPTILHATAPHNNTFYGDSVWSGDLNGDGHIDLVIGASRDSSAGINSSGAVYLRYGPSFQFEQKIGAPHQQHCSGSSYCAEFGREVSAADVTGDGQVDLIIGARGKTVNSKTRAGAVYILPGPNFSSSSAIELTEPLATGGPDTSAWFGQIARPLDWNADGIADLLITARKGKSVFLSSPNSVQDEAGEAWIILGPVVSPALQNSQVIYLRHLNDSIAPQFGYGASIGDVNGDGRDDAVIGAYRYDHDSLSNDDTGAVFVFLSPEISTSSIDFADYVLQPPLDRYGYFGHELVVADFNNDGFGDVAYGGEFGDSGGLNAGTVRISYGPTFSSAERILSSPQPRVGTQSSTSVSGGPGGLFGGGFGSDVSTCDVNGDGFKDLVVGEFYASRNGLDRSGAAWLFLGPTFEQSLELRSDWLQNYGYDGRRVFCLPKSDGFGVAGVGSPYTLGGTGRIRLYSW